MFTLQETFDTVARHLLTQKARSFNVEGSCKYRSESGLKCAIGCLIPDEEYSPNIESASVARLLRSAITPPSLRLHDEDLLTKLQSLHDNISPHMWHASLAARAHYLALSAAVLEEFQP